MPCTLPANRYIRHEGDPLSPEFGVVLRGTVGAYEKAPVGPDEGEAEPVPDRRGSILGAVKRVMANGASATGAGIGKLMYV